MPTIRIAGKAVQDMSPHIGKYYLGIKLEAIDKLVEAVKDGVACVEELDLTRDLIMVLVETETRVSEEEKGILVKIDGLLQSNKRTPAVLDKLAKAVGGSVRQYFRSKAISFSKITVNIAPLQPAYLTWTGL